MAIVEVLIPGLPGPAGPAGPAGVGSYWHRGAGAPGAGVGANGDYYLNTTNGDIYGPKTGGAWGAVVFNIAEGQEGPPGPTGPTGVVNATGPITYNSGTQTVGINIGTTAGTAAAGNDPRFTDAREWSADTITQAEAEAGVGTTRRAFTAARVFQAIAAWWAASTAKAKLDGIASGATANATDAQLRDRSTHTGTQPASTITGLAAVASSGAYGDLSGRPDLTLKADLVGGVIPSSQIPAIAISDYLGSAASQAAMLTLSGQRGDWCIRTDGANAGAWILAGEPSSTLENWVKVPMPAVPVESVNGQVGAVTLGPADVGAAALSHTQFASTISDSTAAGRALLTAADAAAQRTSLGLGTLATANAATPPALGGTTPAAGTFTVLAATTGLTLPSGAPVSPTARDLYAVANTLRYRDSSAAERLLLNAQDNLANLADPAVARTNLGALPIAFAASAITYGATVDLDMAALVGGYRTISLTGNITFTTSNRASGRTVTIRLICDATQRSLTFPAGWVFLGTKPSNIAASKTAVLSLSFFGSADTDCVAAYGVQA